MQTKKENDFEGILEEFLEPKRKYDSKESPPPKHAKPPARGRLEPIAKDVLQKIKAEKIAHKILDLHGYTKEEAFNKVQESIINAYNQNIRVLLIITGKGKNGEGVLKKIIPKYLNHATIGAYIIGMAEALPKHGGSGALYVYLRKNV